MNLNNLTTPEILRKVRSKNFLYTVLTAIYFFAVIELHLTISNFVTHPQNMLLINIRPRNLAFPLTLIVFIMLLLYLVYQLVKGSRRAISVFYWFVLLFAGILIYKFLMVHPVEIAHYFQYALGAFLLSKALDPTGKEFRFVEVVTITSFIGAFDEFYQFFVHCPAYCRYMDWMDIWMNIVAAGIGGLLIYGFKEYNNPNYKINLPFLKKTFIFILSLSTLFFFLSLAGILNFYTDRLIPPRGIVWEDSLKIFFEREPGVYDSWQKTFHTGYFYVPGPLFGILGIFSLYFFLLFYTPGLFELFKQKIKSCFFK
ncbi:MAG: VanZ family protein [Ignavibacteriaceae bacterium]